MDLGRELSQPLRIAVCDDNKEMLQQIVRDVEARFGGGGCRDMTLHAFESGLDLVNAVKRHERFDIILLDVLMPLMDGMETAREIRLMDKTAKIIFLTSSSQFALDSYDVKAFSYVLKNRSEEKLAAVLQEAIAETANTAGDFTMLKTRTGYIKVHFHSLEYLEIMGRTITFYLSDGQRLEVSGTLTEMEELFLCQERFIKPHRSYIVNMDCIRRLDRNEITMLNNHKIPVSKNLSHNVKKGYMNYSFHRGGKDD
jgi:DNA-binding LytR/AlgR family response regulator